MWNSGRQRISVSVGSQCHAMRTASALASRLPCDSSAPFGAPVVPDVNGSSAGSSGRHESSSGTMPSGRPTSTPVTIMPSGIHAAQLVALDDRGARLRVSTSTSISRREYALFTGTTTRPSRSAPQWATIRSADASPDTRTRSPARSPAACSRAATRAVRSSRSKPSSHVPSTSRMIGAMGSAFHCSLHAAGRLTRPSRSMVRVPYRGRAPAPRRRPRDRPHRRPRRARPACASSPTGAPT